MIFFQPTEAFVKWLIDHAGPRSIIDVGCGHGHLLGCLWRAGCERVAGIDPLWSERYSQEPGFNYRESQRPDYIPGHRIVNAFAEGSPIIQQAANCLLVIARPTHTGWVERTVRAVHPASEVLYISDPRNVKEDLGKLRATPLRTPRPGHERERVYQVEHHPQRGARTRALAHAAP